MTKTAKTSQNDAHCNRNAVPLSQGFLQGTKSDPEALPVRTDTMTKVIMICLLLGLSSVPEPQDSVLYYRSFCLHVLLPAMLLEVIVGVVKTIPWLSWLILCCALVSYLQVPV